MSLAFFFFFKSTRKNDRISGTKFNKIQKKIVNGKNATTITDNNGGSYKRAKYHESALSNTNALLRIHW